MKIKLILLPGLLALFLHGCAQEVVTVADIYTDEREATEYEYIEIKELELKGTDTQEDSTGGIRHCVVAIPAGYVESKEIPGMYLHERNPLDASNVYYSVSPLDGHEMDYQDLTASAYKQAVESAYEESGRDKPDLTVTSFEKQQLEGFPTYMIRTTFGEGDNRIEQLIYLIIADEVYTITYSQAADDELFADFKVSEGKISLVRK
jgi:hypothetical protein